MRIYNITEQNSLKSLWLDMGLLFFITLVSFTACIFDLNFITFVILFMVIILDILTVISIYKKRKDYNETKSFHKLIHYVDFLDEGIQISAFDEKGIERLIGYKYSQIEGINIVLETYDSSLTRKHYTAIRDIAVHFYTNDGLVYILHSYHLTFGGSLRTLYNIIDYSKLAPKYTYTLKGTGDHSEIKEKLDYYIKYDKKLYVEPSGRKELKLLSIIIFLWGCAMGVIVIAPFFAIRGIILTCLSFLLISVLIYLPVLIDKNNEQI